MILLDWNMPQLDGAGVIAHLADHPVLRAGNTVMRMSATGRVRSQQVACWAGIVAAILDKPLELDEVLGLV